MLLDKFSYSESIEIRRVFEGEPCCSKHSKILSNSKILSKNLLSGRLFFRKELLKRIEYVKECQMVLNKIFGRAGSFSEYFSYTDIKRFRSRYRFKKWVMFKDVDFVTNSFKKELEEQLKMCVLCKKILRRL